MGSLRITIFHLVISLILIVVRFGPSAAQGATDEGPARTSDLVSSLYNFYNILDGIHWTCSLQNTDGTSFVAWSFIDGPDTVVDPCQSNWVGLSCSNPPMVDSIVLSNCGLHGRLQSAQMTGFIGLVTYLDLSNNRISGTLPDIIESFPTTMGYLDLSQNDISGSVINISWPASLQSLNLAYNKISGPIGSIISGSSMLNSISLGNNLLTGPLPDTFDALVNMTFFDASYNSVNGSLPSSLGSLTLLNTLVLNNNFLIGPLLGSFFAFTSSLQILDLSFNSLEGSIPMFIGQGATTNLLLLLLSTNRLTGTIPSTLGEMTSLQVLLLGDNLLRGALPPEMSSLSRLKRLQLRFNQISGTLPPEYSALVLLQELDFGSMRLSGIIPSDYAQMFSLQTMILSFNGLTGNIPTTFGAMINLTNIDVSSNRLSGLLPIELANLDNLNAFAVQNNSYYGSIPDFLGMLTSLNSLNLASNSFSSTLPSILAQLPSLHLLWCQSNSLTGPIPQSYKSLPMHHFVARHNKLSGNLNFLLNWTRLISLSIEDNLFSSTLPAGLANFSSLALLFVQKNRLEGELPALTSSSLLAINMSSNSLNSSIPASFRFMSSLQYLDLSHNHLRSSIPEQLCSLSSLRYLYVQDNALTGTISSRFSTGCLVRLSHFHAGNNQIGGSLPPAFSGMQNLEQLSLSGNHFTGKISVEFRNWTMMNVLSLDSNRFTSSIPNSLFEGLTRLISFKVQENQITGTIPASLLSVTGLQILMLQNNQISGQFPEPMTKLPSLRRLFLSNNAISGTIPESLSNTKLTAVGLDNLRLTGSIPDSFACLPLEYLSVHNNRLTNKGSGFAFLNFTGPLQYLDLSSNEFQGTIPERIFLIPNLTNLALAANCFNGPLSPNKFVCTATKLQSLVLDGLSSSRNCRTKIWGDNSLGLTGISAKPMQGSVPSCIFRLPDISLLHFSGNGFYGTLSRSLSPSLVDLALSNNRYSGPIKDSLQLQFSQLARLDLSSNKLSGAITPLAKTPKQSLDLKINRLSGKLSVAIIAMGSQKGTNESSVHQRVDVLAGNLFDCVTPVAGFPAADPYISKATCGSSSANNYAVSFAALFVVALGGYYWLYLRQREQNVSILTYLNNVDSNSVLEIGAEDALEIASILQELKGLRTFSFYLCFVAILIAFPYNGLLSISTTVLTYPYIWRFSAAYKTGIFASVCVILASSVLSCGFIFLLTHFLHGKESTHSSLRSRKSVAASPVSPAMVTLKSARMVSLLLAFRLVLLFVLNCVFTIGVNSAFVYIMITADSPGQTAATLALSVFNFAWNIEQVTEAKIFFFGVSDAEIENSALEAPWIHHLRGSFGFKFLLGCTKTVGAPFIASAVTNPACFLQFFIAPEPIKSTYKHVFCDVNIIDYILPTLETGTRKISFLTYQASVQTCSALPASVSVQSPFVYNFQCSSAILRNFIPPMMLTALTDTFLFPVKIWIIRQLLTWLQLPHVVKNALYGMVPPLTLTRDERLVVIHKVVSEVSEMESEKERSIVEKDKGGGYWSDALDFLFTRGGPKEKNEEQILKEKEEEERKKNEEEAKKSLFDAKGFCVNMLERLGIAMSFGTVFPLLMVMIMTSIFSTATIHYKLIKSFISNPEGMVDGELDLLSRNLKSLFEHGSRPIYSPRWILLAVATSFAAFFSFDTAGDAAGLAIAVPCSVFTACIPLFLAWAIEYVLLRQQEDIDTRAPAQGVIELREIVVSRNAVPVPLVLSPIHSVVRERNPGVLPENTAYQARLSIEPARSTPARGEE